ncbi:hypothetical protein FB45DRAFT_1063924 [Roridomyces roridus]|uniref:SH3 domain-containing protein n=1 Tax=Roridomyces roridus TaxID=1738132 RepID=A0AAD7BBL4_9AGAR|nr:hypothetical protein FB45DRAFT_1063924 [Roridomyces roridus]
MHLPAAFRFALLLAALAGVNASFECTMYSNLNSRTCADVSCDVVGQYLAGQTATFDCVDADTIHLEGVNGSVWWARDESNNWVPVGNMIGIDGESCDSTSSSPNPAKETTSSPPKGTTPDTPESHKSTPTAAIGGGSLSCGSGDQARIVGGELHASQARIWEKATTPSCFPPGAEYQTPPMPMPTPTPTPAPVPPTTPVAVSVAPYTPAPPERVVEIRDPSTGGLTVDRGSPHALIATQRAMWEKATGVPSPASIASSSTGAGSSSGASGSATAPAVSEVQFRAMAERVAQLADYAWWGGAGAAAELYPRMNSHWMNVELRIMARQEGAEAKTAEDRNMIVSVRRIALRPSIDSRKQKRQEKTGVRDRWKIITSDMEV